MSGQGWSFTQTREQAKKAVKDLLMNAEQYHKDAKLSYDNEYLQHISLPIVFALEELGSARIILDKLTKSAGDVVLDNYDGLYKHHRKIEKIKDELEISDEKKQWVVDVWKNFPDAFVSMSAEHYGEQFRKLYEDELKNHLAKAANLRINDSFVIFDHNNGNSKLNDPMNKSHAEVRIGAIGKLIKKLENELNSLS